MSEMQGTASKQKHTVEISIDGDDYTASSKEMTPDAILGLAGIDATQNYLVKKHGREQTSYKGKGSTPIELHEHDVFISVPTGDATVS